MAYIGKSPSTGIRNRFIYTATAGQTTFSGSDDHSRTLNYNDAEFTDVFLNGVKLDKSDYTATSGTSIVLDEAAAVDDIVEVLAFDTFSVFSGEFSQDVTVGGTLTASADATITGDLTVDTNTLHVDSANNRVGVNTVSPDANLHIDGNVSISSNEKIQFGSVNRYIQNPSGTELRLGADNSSGIITGYTNGTERMRIDSSGNALFGKTSVTNSGGGHVLRGSDSALFSRNASNVASETIQVTRHASDGLLMRFNTGSSGSATMKGGIGTFTGDGIYFTTGTGASKRVSINNDGRLACAKELHAGITQTATGSTTITNGEFSVVVYGADSGDYTYIASRTVQDSDDVFRARIDANNKIRFTAAGNGYWDGNGDAGGADYAEYFEWDDGNTNDEDRVGYSVVLTNGNKIRKATSSDAAADIIGVVSGRPAFVGDSAYLGWQGKWDTDDFARRQKEDITFYEWTDAEGEEHKHRADKLPDGVTVPADASSRIRKQDRLSPSYDSTQGYTPREERSEWDTVGLVGKLRLRAGQPTGDRWIKMRDIATDDDGNVTVEEWLVR